MDAVEEKLRATDRNWTQNFQPDFAIFYYCKKSLQI
jgi:hypothetical protein